MNVNRIPAVIIQTPNSERFLPLFKAISKSEVLEPVLIVATSNQSSALGLLDYKNLHVEGCANNSPLRFRKLLAETPLAVATVLTPIAADEILKSAATSSQTADWPKSKCRFYILSEGCVRHGDATSGTVIGDTAMRVSGRTPQLFSRHGLTFRHHRLLQKLDTFLIPRYQPICPFCRFSATT